jgi:hypothetical protein
MAMNKHDPSIQLDARPTRPSRRARLHKLLFTGATFGTTLLAVGATASPKLPPFVAE